MAKERPTGKAEEEAAAGQSGESGGSIEGSATTPTRATTVPIKKAPMAKPPGQSTSSNHQAVSPPTDEPPAMMVVNGSRLIALHPFPHQVRPVFAAGYGPVNYFQPMMAGGGHVQLVRDRQLPILLPKGLMATAIPPPNAEIQATEADLVQQPDGSFKFSDEFNRRVREAGAMQILAPQGAPVHYQQAPLMGPSSSVIEFAGSNGSMPLHEPVYNGGGVPPPTPVFAQSDGHAQGSSQGPPPDPVVVNQHIGQLQGVAVGVSDAQLTNQHVTGTQERNEATKKEKKKKEEQTLASSAGQAQSGSVSTETQAEAPSRPPENKQDNNAGAKVEKKKDEGVGGSMRRVSSRSSLRKTSDAQDKKKEEGQNGVAASSSMPTQASRKDRAGGSGLRRDDSRASTVQTATDESDQILEALGADEVAQKQKRKRNGGGKKESNKEAAPVVPKRVKKEEEDAEENPINGEETSIPINEARTAISQAAVVWMQHRLEMDIPLSERKQTPKATTSAGASEPRKKGKTASSELQQLLAMDFGPKENTRRSREVLPVVIHTAETAKTRVQMLQETAGTSARVSRRGTARPSTSSSAEKVKRTLRHRDGTTKCAICGQSFDPSSVDFEALSGHCSEACYNITAGALEDDNANDRSTPEIGEDYVRKESPTKEGAKEEPVSAPVLRPTVTPKKRGRKAKTAEKGETPKTNDAAKKEEKKEKKIEEKEKKEEDQRPRNRNRKRVVKKEESEEESEEEETEEEEEEEEEEPVVKASKVQAPAVPVVSAPRRVAAAPPAAAPAAIPQPAAAAAAAAAAVAPPPAAAAAVAPVMDKATFIAMTTGQVREWAEAFLGSAEAAKRFFDEDIDGKVLIDLSYQDLKEDLKLSMGHSKKVHSELEKINKNK